MADLDDLVTTNIGMIAFWNALDHRVAPGSGDVDPTDCIAIFDSYVVYDNGIEGYKGIGSGRYFHARVKTDGWIISWIDRSNTFGYPIKPAADFGESGYKGYYDILYNWMSLNANISASQTTLCYLIDALYTALSNAADFTFEDAAVGHYCYEYPLSSSLSLIDISVNGADQEGTFQYTSGTNIYYGAVAGSTQSSNTARDRRVFFEGTLIAGREDGGSSAADHGVADLVAEGWIPTALTDYALTLDVWPIVETYAHGSILLIWK